MRRSFKQILISCIIGLLCLVESKLIECKNFLCGNTHDASCFQIGANITMSTLNCGSVKFLLFDIISQTNGQFNEIYLNNNFNIFSSQRPMNNNTMPVLKRYSGVKCHEDIQCYSNSCVNEICEGKHLNELCNEITDEYCQNSLVCVNNICSIPKADDQSCDTNVDCLSSSICHENICVKYGSLRQINNNKNLSVSFNQIDMKCHSLLKDINQRCIDIDDKTEIIDYNPSNGLSKMTIDHSSNRLSKIAIDNPSKGLSKMTFDNPSNDLFQIPIGSPSNGLSNVTIDNPTNGLQKMIVGNPSNEKSEIAADNPSNGLSEMPVGNPSNVLSEIAVHNLSHELSKMTIGNLSKEKSEISLDNPNVLSEMAVGNPSNVLSEIAIGNPSNELSEMTVGNLSNEMTVDNPSYQFSCALFSSDKLYVRMNVIPKIIKERLVFLRSQIQNELCPSTLKFSENCNVIREYMIEYREIQVMYANIHLLINMPSCLQNTLRFERLFNIFKDSFYLGKQNRIQTEISSQTDSKKQDSDQHVDNPDSEKKKQDVSNDDSSDSITQILIYSVVLISIGVCGCLMLKRRRGQQAQEILPQTTSTLVLNKVNSKEKKQSIQLTSEMKEKLNLEYNPTSAKGENQNEISQVYGGVVLSPDSKQNENVDTSMGQNLFSIDGHDDLETSKEPKQLRQTEGEASIENDLLYENVFNLEGDNIEKPNSARKKRKLANRRKIIKKDSDKKYEVVEE